MAIASGSLDSLPANGYLVMLIHHICGETHSRTYGPIFVLTVVIPALGTAVAILLFAWVPQWGRMEPRAEFVRRSPPALFGTVLSVFTTP